MLLYGDDIVLLVGGPAYLQRLLDALGDLSTSSLHVCERGKVQGHHSWLLGGFQLLGEAAGCGGLLLVPGAGGLGGPCPAVVSGSPVAQLVYLGC